MVLVLRQIESMTRCCPLRLGCREQDPADEFVDDIDVWVFEEDYEGRKLSEIINETKTNPKYFPGHHLGDNIRRDGPRSWLSATVSTYAPTHLAACPFSGLCQS